MRFGLLVILMLAVGAVAAHFLLQDNGYVLINFRGYAVEMSVPIMAFALLMFYLLMRLLVRIWRVPRDLGEAASRARDRRAGRRSNEAMIALSEGKLARGERLLTRAASGSAWTRARARIRARSSSGCLRCARGKLCQRASTAALSARGSAINPLIA